MPLKFEMDHICLQSLSKGTKYACNVRNCSRVTLLWFLDEPRENKFSMIASIFGPCHENYCNYLWSIPIQITFYQNTLHSQLDRPHSTTRPLLGPSTFHGPSILDRSILDRPFCTVNFQTNPKFSFRYVVDALVNLTCCILCHSTWRTILRPWTGKPDVEIVS